MALQALGSLRQLFGLRQAVGGLPTDARRVAELLWLPFWVWAGAWLAFSLLAVALALRFPLH